MIKQNKKIRIGQNQTQKRGKEKAQEMQIQK